MKKPLVLTAILVFVAFHGCGANDEERENLLMENAQLKHQNRSYVRTNSEQREQIRNLEGSRDLESGRGPESGSNLAALRHALTKAGRIKDAEGKYSFICVVLDEEGRANPEPFLKQLEKKKLQAEPGREAGVYYVIPRQTIFSPLLALQIKKAKSDRTLDKAVAELKAIKGVAKVFPFSRMYFPCVLVWGSKGVGLEIRIDVELLGVEWDFFADQGVDRERYNAYKGGTAPAVMSRSLVRYIEALAYKLQGTKLAGEESLKDAYLHLKLPASHFINIGTKPFSKTVKIAGFTDRMNRFAFIVTPGVIEGWNGQSFKKMQEELKPGSNNTTEGQNGG